MATRKKRAGEFTLIERYFRPLATNEGAFGLIDDAALLSPQGREDLVLTVDTVAAGVHFFPGDPPAAIARKALRVNLSDLAAKGAKPLGYLLSLALPKNWTEKWLQDFSRALAEDQANFGISLLGGDTTRAAGGLTITITAIGARNWAPIALDSAIGSRPNTSAAEVISTGRRRTGPARRIASSRAMPCSRSWFV